MSALLDRDLKDIAQVRRRDAMRQLVEILAAWSSKFMDISSIGTNLPIQRPTLESYINALETLFIVERLPPWTKTDYERVSRRSKLFMTDSGLMASILGWTADKDHLDADRIGKLFETFVFAELSSQVDASDGMYRLFHYRDRERREVDSLIEREDGALLGVEVKASATVERRDFRHLTWFRDNIAGERPFFGVVLHAGAFCASQACPAEHCGDARRRCSSPPLPAARVDVLKPPEIPFVVCGSHTVVRRRRRGRRPRPGLLREVRLPSVLGPRAAHTGAAHVRDRRAAGDLSCAAGPSPSELSREARATARPSRPAARAAPAARTRGVRSRTGPPCSQACRPRGRRTYRWSGGGRQGST